MMNDTTRFLIVPSWEIDIMVSFILGLVLLLLKSHITSEAPTMRDFIVHAMKIASSVDSALIILYKKEMCCISRYPVNKPWVVCSIDDQKDVSLIYPSHYTELQDTYKKRSVQNFVDAYGDIKVFPFSDEPHPPKKEE
jgi:hypothetical protein